MIVTPKFKHLQVIVTEIKQMTLRLYLSYLIAKSVIPFTSGYAVYNTIFSKNIMLVAHTYSFFTRRTNCLGVDPEFHKIYEILLS